MRLKQCRRKCFHRLVAPHYVGHQINSDVIDEVHDVFCVLFFLCSAHCTLATFLCSVLSHSSFAMVCFSFAIPLLFRYYVSLLLYCFFRLILLLCLLFLHCVFFFFCHAPLFPYSVLLFLYCHRACLLSLCSLVTASFMPFPHCFFFCSITLFVCRQLCLIFFCQCQVSVHAE